MGGRAARRGAGLSLRARVRRRLRPSLPLLVCIDVEPDERQVDAADPSWEGFERLLGLLPELRERIGGRLEGPAVLNWFVRADFQIELVHGDAGWAFQRYAAEWEQLRAAGDEIGIHVHAWRADSDGSWIADHGDAAWVDQCLTTAVEAYRRAFGAVPPSSRCGDRFLSNEVIARLEQSGIEADVTVEPRMRAASAVVDSERATGALPNYANAPERTYHPSTTDFLVPDTNERRLTEIPLTPGGPEVLYPWMPRFQFSERLHEFVLAEDWTHLAFAVRSDLALDDDAWLQMLENLETVAHVAAAIADRRLHLSTASELARSS